MKRTTKLLGLLLVVALMCGCKEDNWLDWKLQNELWLQEERRHSNHSDRFAIQVY